MPASPDENPDSSEWYYQLLGLATGPVSAERLKWLLENDHLTAESLIGRSEDGPWQRLGESPFAGMVSQSAAPKKAEKKKAVRISSGKKASSRKLPAVRDKAKPVRRKPVAPVDSDGYVTDGIEIDETVGEFRLEETAPPPKPKHPPTPTPAPKPPAAADVYDNLEVVSPRAERDSPQSRAARKKEQQLWYLKVAGALIGVVLVVLLGRMMFGPKSDPVGKAYDCFTSVAAGIERNSVAMNDIHWNQWVKDSRVEVNEVLEPLREEANAGEPGIQSLVWAGETLLKMLAGSRVVPDQLTAKFENYMADFAEAPMSDAPAPVQSAAGEDATTAAGD